MPDNSPETENEDVETAQAEAADETDAEQAAVEQTDQSEQSEAAEERPPVPDQLRSGDVVLGTVAKLVDFGAFVDVETGMGVVTGLVHVSEVAPGFVENIYAELGEGEEVRVKVLNIGDDGKVGLSIKQADPDWEEMAELDRPMRSKIDKDFDRRLRKFMHGSQSIQGEVRRQKRNKLGS